VTSRRSPTLQACLGSDAATLLAQIAAAIAPGRVAICGEAAHRILGGERPRVATVWVEGNLAALGRELSLPAELEVRSNLRTATVSLRFPDGPRLDLTVSRRAAFDSPGALPTRTVARLEEALASGDFTVDALAWTVSEDAKIAVLDPCGALDDLDAGRLRLLDPQGFVVVPTRLLRASRLSTRFGWTLDAAAQRAFQEAIEADAASAVSADRLRSEWNALLTNDDATDQLVGLRCTGAHAAVYLPDIDPGELRRRFQAVRACLDQVGDRADEGDAFLCGWVFDAPQEVRSAVLARLAVPMSRVGRFRLPEVADPLEDPADCWAALSPLRPTELAAFSASGRPDAQRALQHYVDEIRRRTGRE